MDSHIGKRIEAQYDRTVFLEQNSLLFRQRCKIITSHLCIGSPSLYIAAEIHHTADRIRICTLVIYCLIQMPRIALMGQCRKQRQVIIHMCSVDIDYIFSCIIDCRDHIKCRTQMLFHLFRHIFYFQGCVGSLRECLFDSVLQF